MKKLMKLLLLLGFCIITVIVSYKIAYYIGETYFFDKLFYNKSRSHGYWITWKMNELASFGARTQDLRTYLGNHISFYRSSQSDKQQQVLGAAASSQYTVVVLGDSYAWGQGVHFEESVSQVLKQKLNEKRKTRVISLGMDGDDLVDNLAKYSIIKGITRVDLYIFVVVDNDLLFHAKRRYDTDKFQLFDSQCYVRTGKHSTTAIVQSDDASRATVENVYRTNNAEANKNTANLCVGDLAAQELPKDRAIYFIPDDYTGHDPWFQNLIRPLQNNGLFVLSSNKARTLPKYEKYWEHPFINFRISSIEHHPSRLAHRMYADVLFNEIIHNARWKFSTIQ